MKETKKFPDIKFWLPFCGFILLGLFFQFCMRGYSFTVLVCFCIAALFLCYKLLRILEKPKPKAAKILRRILTVCLCFGLLIVAVTECLIIHASFGDPDEECEYVIVLGAKVRGDGPSVSLQDRIQAAYDYMTEHPNVISVVSGGRGNDEPISEAQCMYDNLVAMGIDPERIWMEDQATSTWENLNLSLDLIEEKTGSRPTKVGILSSEYHLFRAGLLADACGVETVGIPAETSKFSQKVNHFMREVAGVWHYILLGGQYHA